MRRSATKLAAISAFLLLSLASLASQATTPQADHVTFAALKGPSGIGMVRLFDAPPAVTGFSAVAVASADLMATKVVSGEYDIAVLPINMAAKLRSAGVPIVLAAVVGDGMVSFLTSDPTVKSLAD